MKAIKLTLVLGLLALLVGVTKGVAQTAWTFKVVTLATSTPAAIIPAGTKDEICLHSAQPHPLASPNPAQCFAYTGALPSAVPSVAYRELSQGETWCDHATDQHEKTAISETWACALSAGTTALNISAWWR